MKAICAILAAGLLVAFQPPARAELANGIKAVVHDTIITYQEVEDYTAPFRDELLRQYRNRPEEFQKRLVEALEDNLDRLMQNRLILHDFETAGIYSLPDSLIDEELQAHIRTSFGDDRVRFIKTLQAEGKTYEQFRKEFRDRIITSQMRYAHASRNVIVSPHKIEVYYVGHKDQFKVESQVKLRMIVLTNSVDDTETARKLGQEILGRINDGAAFAEMASVYSQGSQRSQGGDWGWVEKSVLRKELSEVAFALKSGEKSGVIETPEACYLMLVEDTRPEHIKPLNEVRDEIEKTLLGQERDRLQRQWIERLKKKTFVRYF